MLSESVMLPRTPRPSDADPRGTGAFAAAPDAFSCFLMPGKDGALAARVMDLSPDGIRLALQRRLEPGAILGIEWRRRGCQTPCFLLAIIQRGVARAASGWVVTGRFAHKLNPDEWRALQ